MGDCVESKDRTESKPPPKSMHCSYFAEIKLITIKRAEEINNYSTAWKFHVMEIKNKKVHRMENKML
jgi:hypothetical protein